MPCVCAQEAVQRSSGLRIGVCGCRVWRMVPVQQFPGLRVGVCGCRVWRVVPALLGLGDARAMGALQEGRPGAAGHAPARVQRQRALARLRADPLRGRHWHLHRRAAMPRPCLVIRSRLHVSPALCASPSLPPAPSQARCHAVAKLCHWETAACSSCPQPQAALWRSAHALPVSMGPGPGPVPLLLSIYSLIVNRTGMNWELEALPAQETCEPAQYGGIAL